MADINPEFFAQRQPIETGIGMLLQGALQASQQNVSQRNAQLEAQTAAENAQRAAAAQKTASMLQYNLGLKKLDADQQDNALNYQLQSQQANMAQDIRKQQLNQAQQELDLHDQQWQAQLGQLSQKQDLDRSFRTAVANGDNRTAFSIDPERFSQIQAAALQADQKPLLTNLQAQQRLAQLQLIQEKINNTQKQSANLANPGERSFDVSMGKQNASAFKQIVDDSNAAGEDYQRIQSVLPSLNRIYTGTSGEQVQAIRQVASQLFPNWVDPGDAAIASNLNSYKNQAMVQLTVPYKGAISDKEFTAFSNSVAGLGTSPAGNKLLLQLAQAAASRKIEKANFLQAWRQKFQGTPEANDISKVNTAWTNYISDPNNSVISFDKEGKVNGVDPSNISSWKLYLDSYDPSKPRSLFENKEQKAPSGVEAELRKRGLIK